MAEQPKMQTKKIASPVPFYCMAAVCLIYCLSGAPLYHLRDFIILAVLVVAVGWVSRRIFKPKIIQVEIPEPEPVYSAEVREIVREGERAQQEMGRLYSAISDPAVRSRITELMEITDKIVQDAKEDPGDVPQIRRFFSYYLPTTIKLLNAYDRMSAQGVSGENISGTMRSIENMLDRAVAAYQKQLDSLFADQALDIETDIQVMNAMLAREGLGEDEIRKAAQKKQQADKPAESQSPFGSASPVEKLRRDKPR